MKPLHLKIILTAVCILAILAFIYISYADFDKNDRRNPTNDGLTSIIDFDVDCPEVGTSAKGTIFVMQSKNSVKMIITADLNVGETDIGGIGFYFPAEELNVVSVFCSFKGDTSGKYVRINEPISLKTWWVDIGRRPYIGDPLSGGGQGMLILELQLSKSVKLSEIDSLEISIYVGGKDNIMGLVGERFTIPISH
jgi:hypothetical protein